MKGTTICFLLLSFSHFFFFGLIVELFEFAILKKKKKTQVFIVVEVTWWMSTILILIDYLWSNCWLQLTASTKSVRIIADLEKKKIVTQKMSL